MLKNASWKIDVVREKKKEGVMEREVRHVECAPRTDARARPPTGARNNPVPNGETD